MRSKWVSSPPLHDDDSDTNSGCSVISWNWPFWIKIKSSNQDKDTRKRKGAKERRAELKSHVVPPLFLVLFLEQSIRFILMFVLFKSFPHPFVCLLTDYRTPKTQRRGKCERKRWTTSNEMCIAPCVNGFGSFQCWPDCVSELNSSEEKARLKRPHTTC